LTTVANGSITSRIIEFRHSSWATPDHVKAKLLILIGADDPTVPVAHVNAFAEEMTKAGADWQMVSYGGTKHGFTYPSAATRDRVDRIQQAHG
jgi:dienelactone hydrolase